MGRYARSKGKAASCKGIGRRGGKTKTKTRDLDQINIDLKNPELVTRENGEPYCIQCAREFQTVEVLKKHLNSKIHKHRVRKLKDWPTEC